MRDGFTLQRPLSLTGCKRRISSAYSFPYPPFRYWLSKIIFDNWIDMMIAANHNGVKYATLAFQCAMIDDINIFQVYYSILDEKLHLNKFRSPPPPTPTYNKIIKKHFTLIYKLTARRYTLHLKLVCTHILLQSARQQPRTVNTYMKIYLHRWFRGKTLLCEHTCLICSHSHLNVCPSKNNFEKMLSSEHLA